MIFMMLGGLKYTTISKYLGAFYLIGRVLHLIGYTKYGANARLPGAFFFNNASYFALMMVAIASAMSLAGQLTHPIQDVTAN